MRKYNLSKQLIISYRWALAIMKANVSDETIERLAEIQGKPIVRGLDKTVNNCLDILEGKNENQDADKSKKDCEGVDCLNNSTKECLTN